MKKYLCIYYDPKQDQRGRFQVTAMNVGHAEVQTRDGYFGLLAPPSDERAKELQITVIECG